MKATNSNINKESCIPISSNCIIWQGGDLPCIDLCRGDSISEVVYKGALVIQSIKDSLDLSDMDLSYLFIQCSSCPQPDKTLKNVLELLIAKVKQVEEGSGGGTVTPEDVLVTISGCFRSNDSNGEVVSQLPHTIYTRQIGLKVCAIITSLENHGAQLDNLEQRVAELESDSGESGVPKVSSVCVVPGASNSAPQVRNVDEAWELLERSYCGLKTVLGEPTELINNISLDIQPSGNPAGVYKLTNPAEVLWTDGATNIAQLIRHTLLALSDVRDAVKLIMENCCKITCDDIVVDFDVKLSDDRLTMTLFFITKSSIPNGFEDYNPHFGNRLTISDQYGAMHYANIRIMEAVNDPDGVVIDLSGSPLDPHSDYFLSMDASLKNGTMNCVKCVTKSVTYKDTCSYCEISVIGNKGAADGTLVIIYED